MNKLNLFFIVSLVSSFLILSQQDQFNDLWENMQKEYFEIKHSSLYSKACEYNSVYYSDFISKELNQLVMGKPNKNFLINSCLTKIMVRSYMESTSNYEEIFLTECLSFRTKKAIASITEENNGLLDKNCKILNCSSTTLGHLFYIAKILESYGGGVYPELILEFGGGFGNLAKCFKQILPNSTIVIVDLPEMSIIQKMFLNYTLPDLNVVMHKNKIQKIVTGAVNLVPVYLLEDLDINPDLFVSTFALSESPIQTQKVFIDRQFFNSKKIYIAGQISGWKEIGFNWIVDHKSIIENIRSNYSTVACYPFHFSNNNKFVSYELLAH